MWIFDETFKCIRKKELRRDGTQYGRRRYMSTIGYLGLVCMWYRTRGSSARALCIVFGQTSTPLYKWFKFGRFFLLACLIQDIDTKIEFPTIVQVRMCQDAIGAKYPDVGMAQVAADELKIDF